MITGVPLVLLSIKFNKDYAGTRLEQSVSQQMVIISDYFQGEFGVGLQRSLKEIAESDSLRDYLSASGDDRTISIKRLESNLLRLQKQYPDYSGVYYVDADGEIIDVVVVEITAAGHRFAGTGRIAENGVPEQQHLFGLRERRAAALQQHPRPRHRGEGVPRRHAAISTRGSWGTSHGSGATPHSRAAVRHCAARPSRRSTRLRTRVVP